MIEHVHAAVIVGSGFSGLGAAWRLRQAGIDDLLILEKADGVGGAWWHNRYPGCACDVPSHLYSFSFDLNPDWTRHYAPRAEIQAYLDRFVDRHDLRRHLRLQTELEAARWDEAAAVWRIRAGGVELAARCLILGLGPLHEPLIPEVPGAAEFGRPMIHTATWDPSLDLGGARVAVVGTGASAIQVVPALQPVVSKLHLYQRTPAWILPRDDHPISERRRRLYRAVPAAMGARRAALYWKHEARALLMTRAPGVLDFGSRLARRHLASQVADLALRARLTPDYVMGCKRILVSDDFYPAVAQPNVELLTEAVTALEPGVVVGASGSRREVDALVWATGFHVTDRSPDLPVVGRGGRSMAEVWSGGPQAYLGTWVAGFPNLALLLGPNTGLGHNSMVFMIESQLEQVAAGVTRVASGAARLVDVRPEAQAAYNAELQSRMARTVWASGCRSWYVDPDGVNRVVWPDFTWRYWLRARRWSEGDHVTEG